MNIQEAVKKAGSSKVIFGSEFPLSHPSIELQKIMLLDVSDRERTDILAGNIKTSTKAEIKGGGDGSKKITSLE